jgi:hypothetical protein
MPAPLMRALPDLPAEARADVRARSGSGCVRCGVTIYSYFALPTLGDNRVSPLGAHGEGATILCPACHLLVEEGRLSPSQVHGFAASPIARQRHFARDRLPFSNETPELLVGGPRLVRDTPVPIAIAGTPLLMFTPPRSGVGAIRISVRLGDADGVLYRIVDANEWLITDGRWRFVQRGDRYVIAPARGDTLLVLRIVKRNRIAVEHLRTRVLDQKIEATPDWIEVDGKRMVDQVASGTLVGLDI